MEPVKRSHHNKTYEGPTPDIGDLSGYEAEGGFASHWRPNSEEIAQLVNGGDIEVTLFSKPIPPLIVSVLGAEGAMALPADPESQEVVIAGGEEFRVPPEVAAELKAERDGVTAAVVERLSSLDLDDKDTIVVTVPDDAGPEVTEAILAALASQFPDHRGCVLPESIGLHTRENFAALVEVGSEMARLLGQGRADDATAQAKRWNEITHG